MNYQEFISKCWENHRLLSIMLELTYSCQFKCPFCYNEKKKKGKLLTLKKYEELLEDAKGEGALYLTLTGGEPTLNKLFFQICNTANELHYSIRIKSNGYNWTKEFVKKLKEEVNPFNIDLSIFGAKKETYEKISKIKGSFENFLKTIENLKKENVRIRFKFPVNSINEGEIDEVFEFAKKLNIGIDAFAELSPQDNGALAPLNYIASEKGIEKMFKNYLKNNSNMKNKFLSEEELDKLNIKSKFVCGAGISSSTIDPFGEVFPCVAWRVSLGNIWDNSLKKIWRSKKLKEIIDVNKKAKERKKLVQILEGEFFCPGIALAQYKNPLTIYPEAVKIAKIRKRKENEYEGKKEI